MGEYTQIKTKGGNLRCYLAGKGSGVLVLPSWWGLNPFFVSVCDRLAKEGYAALGVDYYAGKLASTIPQAEKLRLEMDRSATEKQVLEAFDWIVAKSGRSAAVMGFSLGARFAYGVLRARHETLKGIITFYGVGGGRYPGASAPVLAHYAEEDVYGAHQQAAKKMQARLEAEGVRVESFTYPGTRHWFFEEGRPDFNKQAADQAWKRSLVFLNKTL